MRLLAALFAVAASCAAVAEEKPVDLAMQWTIAVAADGTLASIAPVIDPRGRAKPMLFEHIEPAIRAWHFTPGKINGVPTPTTSTLTLHLRLEPAASGDGYSIRLRNAATGATYAEHPSPHFPESALQAHRSGAVLLRVAFDADGTVGDIGTVAGGEPKAGADLQHAAIDAVSHWRFKPESVGGHGRAGYALVPICFEARRDTVCHWNDPERGTPLQVDEPLALDPVVRIETNVADALL
jgi:TonB family protein